MAKGKYQEWLEPEGLLKIEGWARDGLTDEQIAHNMGISPSTLYEWKNAYSEFSESLTPARVYDDEVVNSLHKNTLGGIVELSKPIKCKKRYYENGRLVREEEVIVTAKEEIYVQPDTRAQMYWLNNRVPSKWKINPVDNSEEKSGKDALIEIVNAIKGASEK